MTARSDVVPNTLAGAVSARRMNRRAWTVTLLLVLFQIVSFADKAVLGLVAGKAMPELGLTAGEFGFIGSAFFFLFALAGVGVGALASRVPTRWLILAMGLSWAILQFPMLLGGGAAALLITRIMLGAAEGPATPIALAHVHGWFRGRDRGLPSSTVAIGSTLGPVIAAPVLAWIIANPALGWRWAFGFLGIIGLIWCGAWLLLGRDGPFSQSAARERARGGSAFPDVDRELEEETRALSETEAQAGEVRAVSRGGSVSDRADALPRVPLARVFGTGTFIVAVLAGAGCFWAMGFLTTWSPKYLSAAVALSPEAVGLVSTFPWLVGAAALFLLGLASRGLMRRGVSVRWAIGAPFGATLMLAGALFLALPGAQGASAVVLLTLGAGCAMIFPLAPTAIAFLVGTRQRGIVMATMQGIASLGGVIAPAMVGRFMDNAGYRPGAPGEPDSVEMVGNMLAGIDGTFLIIGTYLVITGLAAVLFLNPDRTADRLQVGVTRRRTVSPRGPLS